MPVQSDGGLISRKRQKKVERGTPDIDAKGPGIDPLFISKLFAPSPTRFSACRKEGFPDEDLRKFVGKALSNRRKCEKTRWNVIMFVLSYYDLAMASHPQAPIFGEEAVITITNWSGLIDFRGPSVPPMARYDLEVFAEALGISMPVTHPSVTKCTKLSKAKPKHAPMAPTEFVILIEKEASNQDNPED